MPKFLADKPVFVDATNIEFVVDDTQELNIDRKDLVDYLLPCFNVPKHLNRILPIAIEWHQKNRIPLPSENEDIFKNYVANGLGTTAPLSYQALRIYAEEKGLFLLVYKVKDREQRTLETIESYEPNRPPSTTLSLLVHDNDATKLTTLTLATLYEVALKKRQNAEAKLIDLVDCEFSDAAGDQGLAEEKAMFKRQIAEKSAINERVSIPFNMEFFDPRLYPAEYAPKQIGALTKEQMLLIQEAYNLLPKTNLNDGREEKPIPETFEDTINLTLPKWKPLLDNAAVWQKAIDEHQKNLADAKDETSSKGLFFKLGPYSTKHVNIAGAAHPTNMMFSGIEAIKLICCDHRIHKAINACLDASTHIDKSYLENKAYPLTMFVSKVNPEIKSKFEMRHFLHPIGKHFALHTSAYQAPTTCTYNLPRNHWLGRAYNRRAIAFLTKNHDFLLTLKMLKMATNLQNYLGDDQIDLVRKSLLVLAANYDIAHRLDIDKDFFIEENPFEALTDTNRFTADELAEYKADAITSDAALIVPGETRVTQLDLDHLIEEFGVDGVEKIKAKCLKEENDAKLPTSPVNRNFTLFHHEEAFAYCICTTSPKHASP